MANTKELLRRLRSVKSTAKITKAMQMVSATKMKRAQNQAFGGRDYSTTLSSILSLAGGKIDPSLHVLLRHNESKRVGVLLLTTDKGLAGALNTNVFRTLQTSPLLHNKEVIYLTVGKKGRDFIVRTGKTLEADFENHERIEPIHATRIRKLLVQMFLEQLVGEVYILYPDFKSTLRQEPRFIRLLPISYQMPEDNQSSINSDVKDSSTRRSAPLVMTQDGLGIANKRGLNDSNEFLFEPSFGAVLDYALIHHIDTQIYQSLLETKASEHSARMIAMQNATNNAQDLVEDLKLTYNQVRQSAITTQILEIASGSAALE